MSDDLGVSGTYLRRIPSPPSESSQKLTIEAQKGKVLVNGEVIFEYKTSSPERKTPQQRAQEMVNILNTLSENGKKKLHHIWLEVTTPSTLQWWWGYTIRAYDDRSLREYVIQNTGIERPLKRIGVPIILQLYDEDFKAKEQEEREQEWLNTYKKFIEKLHQFRLLPTNKEINFIKAQEKEALGWRIYFGTPEQKSKTRFNFSLYYLGSGQYEKARNVLDELQSSHPSGTHPHPLLYFDSLLLEGDIYVIMWTKNLLPSPQLAQDQYFTVINEDYDIGHKMLAYRKLGDLYLLQLMHNDDADKIDELRKKCQSYYEISLQLNKSRIRKDNFSCYRYLSTESIFLTPYEKEMEIIKQGVEKDSFNRSVLYFGKGGLDYLKYENYNDLFEAAKSALGIGRLFSTFTILEEWDLSDKEKIDRLNEAEKWFLAVADGQEFSWVENFHLYLAQGYQGMGNVLIKKALLNKDLNQRIQLIKAGRKQLARAKKFVDFIKTRSPEQFYSSMLDERNAYFQIHLDLANAYLLLFESNKTQNKIYLDLLEEAGNEIDLILDLRNSVQVHGKDEDYITQTSIEVDALILRAKILGFKGERENSLENFTKVRKLYQEALKILEIEDKGGFLKHIKVKLLNEINLLNQKILYLALSDDEFCTTFGKTKEKFYQETNEYVKQIKKIRAGKYFQLQAKIDAAKNLLNTNKVEEAIKIFQEIITSHEKHLEPFQLVEIHLALGDCFLNLRDYNQAKEYYGKVIKNPQALPFQKQLAKDRLLGIQIKKEELR